MRLNKAKALLDDGIMNVTEVAYAVGYSSLSHFAKSFKDYHGAAPGNYLREVSHRW
jgi:transcriptional regulator GlxA family with amidase domain